jgi:hypothetical protein
LYPIFGYLGLIQILKLFNNYWHQIKDNIW